MSFHHASYHSFNGPKLSQLFERDVTPAKFCNIQDRTIRPETNGDVDSASYYYVSDCSSGQHAIRWIELELQKNLTVMDIVLILLLYVLYFSGNIPCSQQLLVTITIQQHLMLVIAVVGIMP